MDDSDIRMAEISVLLQSQPHGLESAGDLVTARLAGAQLVAVERRLSGLVKSGLD